MDYEFDVELGPYERNPEPKPKPPYFLACIVGCWLAIGGFAVGEYVYYEPPGVNYYTAGGGISLPPGGSVNFTAPVPTPEPPKNPWGGFNIKWENRYQDAANQAAAEWSKALKVNISAPRVYSDPTSHGVCNDDAAEACALIGTNVVIASEITPGHEKQVLLHEIGHLLGVTHISGDPTMQPTYDGKLPPVNELSPAAVAVAKVHHMWTRADFPLK